MIGDQMELMHQKLQEEKELRKLAEKTIETYEMTINHNLPEKLGKCFYLISPEGSFESAYRNSPQAFKDFPECANQNLTNAEKFKMYKERKPFIRAICKYCRN